MLMRALHDGSNEWKIVHGEPPDDSEPFIVWGQNWLTLRIVPKAYETKRPFWNIDNGFWQPGRGRGVGFYKITYRGMSPILLQEPDPRRTFKIMPLPWREEGKHVLICIPGQDFGRAIGINVKQWSGDIERRVMAKTDRPVIIREKGCSAPLSQHLRNCWALVTHSSNVAVEAVLMGVPVFVAPTSAAAPVGRTDLEIEEPVMPKRGHWLASLACQHFTLDDMRQGVAAHWMKQVAIQVDGESHG